MSKQRLSELDKKAIRVGGSIGAVVGLVTAITLLVVFQRETPVHYYLPGLIDSVIGLAIVAVTTGVIWFLGAWIGAATADHMSKARQHS